MPVRKTIFWLHLIAGIIAGLAIGIMCFTGVALGFEKQLVSWSERDARQIMPPAADATRLPLRALLKNIRDTNPETRPSSITISSDPADAIAFQLGREGALYANPYTGEIRTPASTKMHDFMHMMEDWHRTLALSGDNRPVGKAINGACNLAFFVLAVSGLYLWLPRQWSWRSVKAVALFNWRLTGKNRDFNWHNTIGLWSAPILIVLTLTAVPISYRWGSNLVYRLAGEEAPIPQGQGGFAAPAAVEIPQPSPDAQPLSQDALLAIAQNQFPDWEQISLRLGGGNPRGGAAGSPQGQRAQAAAPARSARDSFGSEGRVSPQPVTLSVKVPGTWPRTATRTLTLNP